MRSIHILKGFLYTVLGGLFGAGIGYGLVLLSLLLIFGESLGSNLVIIGLTTFIGFLYGICLGIGFFFSPKYINKFVIMGMSLGLVVGAIVSVALDKYHEVAIIGLPILFGLVGVFLDKRREIEEEKSVSDVELRRPKRGEEKTEEKTQKKDEKKNMKSNKKMTKKAKKKPNSKKKKK